MNNNWTLSQTNYVAEAVPSAFPSRIEQLIPHRGGMLLVDKIVRCSVDEQFIKVSSKISPNKGYSKSGAFGSRHWYLEIMAQSAALLAQTCWPVFLEGKPVLGFILSIRHFQCTEQPVPKIGEQVFATCRFLSRLDDVAQCEAHLLNDHDQLLAKAEMTFLSDSKGELSSKVTL
jgi:predicted hotdog family 3-hydroxylacyl-ACP dehydratase